MYQIDQSGKIEDTARPTVIALSNDIQIGLLLRTKDKLIIQGYFRDINQPENYYYFTFAALLAILLSKVKLSKKVYVDREYYGHEEAIKERLSFYYKKIPELKYALPEIEFCLVGKSSAAHILAGKITHKLQKPNIIITSKEIINLIFSNKKRPGIPSSGTAGRLTQGCLPGGRRPPRSMKIIYHKRKRKSRER